MMQTEPVPARLRSRPAAPAARLLSPSQIGAGASGATGITVYDCEPDEAELFARLSPGFGVVPVLTASPPGDAEATGVVRNRCISVSHKSPVSAAILRTLRDAGVDYVSTRCVGLDHIDTEAAARLGIAVGNSVYSPDGVADYTLMLMLMALRDAKPTIAAVAGGDYRLGRVRGRELRDLTVGVIGAGRIGRAVIARLAGFGCRVLVHGTSRARVAVRDVPLADLLAVSDVVTLHLPLGPATHHVIDRAAIAAMKPGALLVNTGRGGLVDTRALIAALDSGRLGGAALDVVEGEEGIFYFDCRRRPVDNQFILQLQAMPNVIITPHAAYYTRRVLHDIVEATIRNCLAFELSRSNAEA